MPTQPAPDIPALIAEVRRLRSVISDVTEILYNAPELNMSNYTEIQVAELNSAVLVAYDFLSKSSSIPEHPCPHCGREMQYGIIGATCASGSHSEIDGWYCESCDYSEEGSE